ncbi:hypothetical protein DUI87_29744 [Hirundo rustica rustica]|uniref:Ig-like domain-containing protein n=1 Tax=Hirundo rustica rustica TaxID=333673 RepID=A0A3M0IZ60_HIRRU|nr:hypothetical protein DUI87_29744 [Hirundo rustica rustica]
MEPPALLALALGTLGVIADVPEPVLNVTGAAPAAGAELRGLCWLPPGATKDAQVRVVSGRAVVHEWARPPLRFALPLPEEQEELELGCQAELGPLTRSSSLRIPLLGVARATFTVSAWPRVAVVAFGGSASVNCSRGACPGDNATLALVTPLDVTAGPGGRRWQSFSLRNVSQWRPGDVTCTGRCGDSEATASVGVLVYTLPEPPDLQAPATLEVGTVANVTCRVTGAFPAGDTRLSAALDRRPLALAAPAVAGDTVTASGRLSAPGPGRRELSCTAAVGAATRTARREIHAYRFPPPTLELSPSTARAGGQVTVTCRAGSSDPPASRLQLLDSAGAVLAQGPRPRLRLRLAARRHHDGRRFRCRASLRLGDAAVAKEASARLAVLYLPEIPAGGCPGRRTWLRGAREALWCRATGNPAPTVVCGRSGGGGGAEVPAEPRPVTRARAGAYVCNATNALGTRSRRVIVRVECERGRRGDGGGDTHGSDIRHGDTHGSDIHESDIHESDIRHGDTHGSDTHDGDTHDSDIHESDTRDGDTHGSDIHGSDIRHGDIRDGDTHESDIHESATHHGDIHRSDTHHRDTHGSDTHDGDTHDSDIHESDIRHGDTHEGDTHGSDIHRSDTHHRDTHGSDTHHGDTHDSDIHYGDTHDRDTQHEDTRHSDTRDSDTRGGDTHHGDSHDGDTHHGGTYDSDTQHGDSHHNDTQHGDTHGGGTHDGDTHHNDTRRGGDTGGGRVVTRADGGRYVCRATNKHGVAVRSVLVTVEYGPGGVALRVLPSAAVPRGGAFTVSCGAEGLPAPAFSWALPPAPNLRLAADNRSVTVTGATAANGGLYTCTASNRHGRRAGSVAVSVDESRPAALAAALAALGGAAALALAAAGGYYLKSTACKKGEYNVRDAEGSSEAARLHRNRREEVFGIQLTQP